MFFRGVEIIFTLIILFDRLQLRVPLQRERTISLWPGELRTEVLSRAKYWRFLRPCHRNFVTFTPRKFSPVIINVNMFSEKFEKSFRVLINLDIGATNVEFSCFCAFSCKDTGNNAIRFVVRSLTSPVKRQPRRVFADYLQVKKSQHPRQVKVMYLGAKGGPRSNSPPFPVPSHSGYQLSQICIWVIEEYWFWRRRPIFTSALAALKRIRPYLPSVNCR